MRDEDKPFVCYKQGWSFKIMPRGAAGWRAFGVWMLALGIMLAAYLIALPRLRDPAMVTIATIGFVTASLIWAVAMIRWMLKRSEIVDLNALLDLKRRNDRAQSSRGRRDY